MPGWRRSNPPNTQFQLNKDSSQARGLVAWWPFLGSKGTSIIRDFNSRNDGTLTGGTWGTHPKMGTGLTLNGSSDRVDMVASGISPHPLYLDSSFSVFAWCVKTTDQLQFVVSRGQNSWDFGFTAGGNIAFYDRAQAVIYTGAVAYPNNELLHIALTVGIGSPLPYAIYVNGALITSSTTSQTFSGSDGFRIGASHNAGSYDRFFAGTVFDVSLYNRALSPVEIWQLYVNPWELYEPVIPVWSVAWVAAGGTTYNQSISGALTPTAVLLNQTQKVSSGSVTPIASLVNQGQKALAGAITPTGGLLNQTQKILGGSLTPAGGLTNQAQKVLSGTLTPLGQLLNQTQKVLSGNVTPSGVLTATKTALISLVGSLTPSGILTKETQKVLSGTITPVGSIFKQIGKILSGALTPIGVLVASLVSTNLESTFKGMFRGMFRRMK